MTDGPRFNLETSTTAAVDPPNLHIGGRAGHGLECRLLAGRVRNDSGAALTPAQHGPLGVERIEGPARAGTDREGVATGSRSFGWRRRRRCDSRSRSASRLVPGSGVSRRVPAGTDRDGDRDAVGRPTPIPVLRPGRRASTGTTGTGTGTGAGITAPFVVAEPGWLWSALRPASSRPSRSSPQLPRYSPTGCRVRSVVPTQDGRAGERSRCRPGRWVTSSRPDPVDIPARPGRHPGPPPGNAQAPSWSRAPVPV
jgi:hypothetical protein